MLDPSVNIKLQELVEKIESLCKEHDIFFSGPSFYEMEDEPLEAEVTIRLWYPSRGDC